MLNHTTQPIKISALKDFMERLLIAVGFNKPTAEIVAGVHLESDLRGIPVQGFNHLPELREDRFAVGTWKTLSTGAPALIDAAAAFDCRLSATFDFGSHRIIVGEVTDLMMREASPLVHSNKTFYHLSALARQ